MGRRGAEFFLCIIETELEQLRGENAELRQEIHRLKLQIALLLNGRKSHTSSTPPSQDIGRANKKSLRQPSDKKQGGQKGHEGQTLSCKAIPDRIEAYVPDYCSCCGEFIAHEPKELKESRQEVVLPPIQAQYVAHQSYSRQCPKCHQPTTAAMPTHLTAPIQYGKSVEAFVGYLSAYQYLPYHRTAALMRDLFGLPLSEGTIDNMLERLCQKAQPYYTSIQQCLAQSPVIGSDETGTSIGGKKGWMHTWQTPSLTFIAAALNRGYATIEHYFPNGFPQAVYVSDCWAAQLKTPALHHQLCIAHLLRELNNFIEGLNCAWSKQMKNLLEQSLALKKELTEQDYSAPPQKVRDINRQLCQLLQQDACGYHKKIQAFIKRLIKHQNSILTFLFHPKVPPDNNASERAIRNVKVKSKISGQFRSQRGAERFAILRSLIDTAKKNVQQAFEPINLLANLAPE